MYDWQTSQISYQLDSASAIYCILCNYSIVLPAFLGGYDVKIMKCAKTCHSPGKKLALRYLTYCFD